MNSLKLTIVIPVYNEENHIKDCLDSIVAQTVMPEEVIVVDNNSTDKSIAYAKEYSFVRVIKESRQGIFYARNAGFNSVKSEFIGRIDADTILPEDWVETALEFMPENPDRLLTGGCYMYDMGYPNLAGFIADNFSFRMNRLILGSYIAWGSNLVFRRELWDMVKDKVCNDDSVHEDIDLGLHLRELGYSVYFDVSRKVGIESRIFSDQRRTREEHFQYLQRWPNTLYRHKFKRAWMGVVGMYMVYHLYWPLLPLHKLGMLQQKLKNSLEEL